MNRDFLLVMAGGAASFLTTLLTLYIAELIEQRRLALKSHDIKSLPNPESNVYKRSEFFKASGSDAVKREEPVAENKVTSPDAPVTDSSIIRKSEN
ncbi:MAG: hypothetical protein HY327_11730 [Chloroflexi bacterium]|nr:hypothetical protein [Chloroflexota bacterium]